MAASCYLVTGGCGFIGSHLVRRLLASGQRVRVLDNLSSGRLENLPSSHPDLEFHKGDICDPAALAAACAEVDGIFHLAALVSVADSVARPADNHRVNATGTLQVLMAAREAGVRRVVFASTAAVYGNGPTLPKREDMSPAPASPYAVAKLMGEHYMQIFHALYGLETASLRFFNAYGPRQDPRSPYSGVIARFIGAVRNSQPATIFGDGRQSRDFVSVHDVARALEAAMQSADARDGSPINIATGRAVDLLRLLEILEALGGRSIDRVFAPARAGDVRHSLADVSRARALLGFEARVPLEEGLKELVEEAR